eukprot:UN04386
MGCHFLFMCMFVGEIGVCVCVVEGRERERKTFSLFFCALFFCTRKKTITKKREKRIRMCKKGGDKGREKKQELVYVGYMLLFFVKSGMKWGL